jgi:phospholipid/cholesterol/gamma-HCH transport system permease protein
VTTASAQLSFDRGADGAIVVRIAGPWLLRESRPGAAELERELDPAHVRRVTFDARDLEGWDSALLAFLVDALRVCKARGIAAERGGLPDGVRRLLALSETAPQAAKRRPVGSPALLERLGLASIDFAVTAAEPVRFLGELATAGARALRLRARFQPADLLLQIQQCGVQALPIVTLIAFLVGLILAFMGAVQLLRFGATIYVADLVTLAMVREMGAVMTAVVLAGRTGAAFAAQLGTMRVTEEIDALRTLGIPPIEYLVLPRVLALVLMMPLLTLYADFWGIFGGAVVATGMLDLTLREFLNEAFASATLVDAALGVGKSVVFGALIGYAGCLRGMQSGQSASAVGDAATSAVVTSIVFIIVTDGLFAVLCNLLGI